MQPKLSRIGFLIDRRSAGYAGYVKSVRRAISRSGIEARFAEVITAEEVEPAFVRLARRARRLSSSFQRAEGGARHAAHSHTAAIDRIESVVNDERIDCEFERLEKSLIPKRELRPQCRGGASSRAGQFMPFAFPLTAAERDDSISSQGDA